MSGPVVGMNDVITLPLMVQPAFGADSKLSHPYAANDTIVIGDPLLVWRNLCAVIIFRRSKPSVKTSRAHMYISSYVAMSMKVFSLASPKSSSIVSPNSIGQSVRIWHGPALMVIKNMNVIMQRYLISSRIAAARSRSLALDGLFRVALELFRLPFTIESTAHGPKRCRFVDLVMIFDVFERLTLQPSNVHGHITRWPEFVHTLSPSGQICPFASVKTISS